MGASPTCKQKDIALVPPKQAFQISWVHNELYRIEIELLFDQSKVSCFYEIDGL